MINLAPFQTLRSKGDFDRMREEFEARKAQRKQAQTLGDLKIQQLQQQMQAQPEQSFEDIVAQSYLAGGLQNLPRETQARALAEQAVRGSQVAQDQFGRTYQKYQPIFDMPASEVAQLTPSMAMGMRMPVQQPTTPAVQPPPVQQPTIPSPQTGVPVFPEFDAPVPTTPQAQPTPAPKITPDVSGLFLPGQQAVRQQAAISGFQQELKQRAEERERSRIKTKEQKDAEKAFKFTLDETDNIIKRVDDAISLVGPFTAGAGSYLNIAGLPVRDLQRSLETVQADSAFSRLQQMRDASPTGGALGQVTERELALLQNARIALSQDQSPAALRKNLEEYKLIRKQALNNVAEAYRSDYGSYPSGFEKFVGRQQQKPLRISVEEFLAE